MKMFAKIQGLKRSKGVMRDTGKEYDSTTVYIEFPFGQSDDMRGSATQPMKFGTSENFAKFANIALPFEAEIDIEAETNGNKVTNVITNIVPLSKNPNQPKTEVKA